MMLVRGILSLGQQFLNMKMGLQPGLLRYGMP
jgi:hypothetical protein